MEQPDDISAPEASVILPAFNEADALPMVIDEITGLGRSYEVIVVDDGSSDGTAEVARSHGAIVVAHDRNRGKGAAIATGAAAARSNKLVFLDADGTYPAAAIPQLVDLLDTHSVARGERPVDSPHIPALNRFGNRTFNRLLGSFHGLEGADHLSGLYAIDRDVLGDMDLEASGFDVEVEIAIKSRLRGLSVAVVPIDYRSRIGEKKLRPLHDGLRILIRVLGMLILYSPVVTFVIPGLVLAALSLLAAAVLNRGPVNAGSPLGLDVHSYVLAVFGVLAGLQAMILGIAAATYRAEAGYHAGRWLVALTRRSIRLSAAVVGIFIGAIGAVWVLGLVIGWLAEGGGDFTATDQLVTAAGLAVLGLQLASAGVFLSIFSGRLRRER